MFVFLNTVAPTHVIPRCVGFERVAYGRRAALGMLGIELITSVRADQIGSCTHAYFEKAVSITERVSSPSKRTPIERRAASVSLLATHVG